MATFSGLMDNADLYTYEVWCLADSWSTPEDGTPDGLLEFEPRHVANIKLPVPYMNTGPSVRPVTSAATQELLRQVPDWFISFFQQVERTEARGHVVAGITKREVQQFLEANEYVVRGAEEYEEYALHVSFNPFRYARQRKQRRRAARFNPKSPQMARWTFYAEIPARGTRGFGVNSVTVVVPPLRFAGVDRHKGPIYWLPGGLQHGFVVATMLSKQVWVRSGRINPITHGSWRLMPVLASAGTPSITTPEVLVRLDEFEERGG